MGAAAVLVAYSGAGFGLVPLLVKSQVTKFGQTELARQATIGDVRFNPFTLRLEAQNLRLAEADGAPLFAIGKLVVELQWKSLVQRAWSFAEIRITAPSASLTISPEGKFNVADLLDTLNRRPREPSTDTGLPRLVIDRFALEQGNVDLRDHQAGYANSFSPIDVALTHFSTLPEADGVYTFTANSERGGQLRWKGDASVNPIQGHGELALENVSLPELGAYLKPYTQAKLVAGQFTATLPYRFAYQDGKFDASLSGAQLSLRDLALARGNAKDAFATLTRLDVNDIHANLSRREATVGEIHAGGGKLAVRRNAKGELDLATLLVSAAAPAAPPATHAAGPAPVVNDWKLGVQQVALDDMAISAVDETASPPLTLSADKLQLHLQLNAAQVGANLNLKATDATFSLANLTLTSGAQTPFRLTQLGFSDGVVDLAARQARLGRVYADGGYLQLMRNRKGQLDLLERLPRFSASEQQLATPKVSADAPWSAVAKRVELSQFGAEIEDQGLGVKLHLQDGGAQLEGVSSDLTTPVLFKAALKVREGGQLSAQGKVLPASGALNADVQVRQLALAPWQPLLSQYVKLKISGGSVSAQGKVTTGTGHPQNPSLRYVGGLDLAGLALNEIHGEQFLAWRNVGAVKLTASLSPNLLDIPELRIVEPNATLIIEDDRSFNATRLLVQAPAADTPTQTQKQEEPFPVRIQRLRVQNAKLDFTDLSLRPQFRAKIYELAGAVNGLSSDRHSRSQVELDGRVDEFGLARIRGEFNPFAPRDNTDVNVVFKNVDMVSTTPYAMKFAGYKIAEGKISLDLQYKVRNSQLEGANQIIIDKLTLGERVDSPDALKLPLELAIALLKDSDGRIDLGLPVSGDMNDPQFSYGALVWKTIGNVLTKIITSPFRALGSLLGISGEKLESIDFDAGSARLLPPEREKLMQVAKLLSKRTQLKLSVPGSYSEAADGAVLKARAVRVEVARRAGIQLDVAEDPGMLNLSDRAVRGALRGLYAERFGAAELEKQKKAAEGTTAVPTRESAPAEIKTQAIQEKLPIWQRVGKLMQGEPQVADASAFYRQLQERLNQREPLAADTLTRLGTQRASAVVQALQEAGVDAASAITTAPEQASADPGKAVPVKLGLAPK